MGVINHEKQNSGTSEAQTAADEFRQTVIAVIELDSMGDINRELFKKRNIRFDEEGKVHINEERE